MDTLDEAWSPQLARLRAALFLSRSACLLRALTSSLEQFLCLCVLTLLRSLCCSFTSIIHQAGEVTTRLGLRQLSTCLPPGAERVTDTLQRLVQWSRFYRNCQIPRNPGGTEHAQKGWCTRLFFLCMPTHESMGTRLAMHMIVGTATSQSALRSI